MNEAGKAKKAAFQAIGLWTIVGVITYSCTYDISGILPGLDLLCKVGHAFWGTLIILTICVPFQFDRRIACVLVVTVTAVAVAFVTFGGRCARLARFHLMKASYQNAIGQIAAHNAKSGFEQDAIINEGSYQIDSGPPIRVIFPWPGGILDNWQGVVYDPTGTIMRINEIAEPFAEVHDPPLNQLQWLFGGKLIAVERLQDGWYFCWFT